jgi:DNA-binding transcriptional MerR regulator
MKGLTVSQLARLAGVSVRTLHHYDEIGLLTPSGRGANGYRLYERAQLQRLQQILFYRELEIPLEEICHIMQDPAFDVLAALVQQRQLLERKAVHVRDVLDAVDAAIDSIKKGTPMNEKKMFEAFEKEAEQRWGDTPQFKESKRRTAKYGKKDWAQMRAEQDALQDELAKALRDGVKPTDARAMALAERHRQHISKWFYDCSYEIHCGLAELYVADPRFTANIDKAQKGLAAYQREAILANAARSTAPRARH